MKDTIIIHGAHYECHIGAGEHERSTAQPIVLDVRLSFDIGIAAASKKLGDTIDYVDVHKALKEHLETKEFVLLETLAETTAVLLLAQFPADTVSLTVRKPRALDLGAPDAWPGIEITRSR